MSPLGNITLASNGVSLTGLWFDGQKCFAESLQKPAQEKTLPVFELSCRWLDIYFGGKNPGFTPPILMRGTIFRKQVWQILLEIPYGHTMTYGEIAERIYGNREMKGMCARAVGGAVGHNPVSIIIPCHRVIGADGNMAGYAGGISRKIQLLELEKKRNYIKRR